MKLPKPLFHVTPEESSRLTAPDVNYFGPELGPFLCGHCAFFNATQGYCENPLIRAPVSYGGCCNRYLPG